MRVRPGSQPNYALFERLYRRVTMATTYQTSPSDELPQNARTTLEFSLVGGFQRFQICLTHFKGFTAKINIISLDHRQPDRCRSHRSGVGVRDMSGCQNPQESSIVGVTRRRLNATRSRLVPDHLQQSNSIFSTSVVQDVHVNPTVC